MNTSQLIKPGVLGALMLVAVVLTIVATPTKRLADAGPKLDLEQLIPRQFGDWRIDETIVPLTVSPDVQAKLDKIYSQTLSRTFRNAKGERIMLSIAYGANQGSDDFQVHRPEYCYAAQGFQLGAVRDEVLNIVGRTVPIRRLHAVNGSRHEPITYWITIGDKATLPGIRRKLIQLSYGLTGRIPDGMLVRVSTLHRNLSVAYELQTKFVNDLLGALDPADQIKIVGNSPS